MSERKTIEIRNPVSGKLIGTVDAAGRPEIDRVLDRAVEGAARWREVPICKKEEIVERFAALLSAHRDELLLLTMLESGGSLNNALLQFRALIPLFRGYLESAKRCFGKQIPCASDTGGSGSDANDLHLVLHEPLGTVLVIVPFNAPLMMFAFKAGAALAAGNSVVVKPPSSNPLAVIRAAELLHEAGVPEDVLQVVTGPGAETGRMLAEDPRIDAITMTGSTNAGLQLAQSAAKRLIPCMLELGGNDPYIVLDDADVMQAAREAAVVRMISAGQVCCSPKRFLVHRSLEEAFTEQVIDYVSSIRLAYDYDPEAELDRFCGRRPPLEGPKGVLMNSLISEQAAGKVEEQVGLSLREGAKLLFGGGRHNAFFEPTVLGSVNGSMSVARDMEIFGPVMPIIGFDSDEEAAALANASCYGLSGGVITKDWKRGMKLARQIRSGCCVIGGSGSYRNYMQHFGGYGMSGVGREGLMDIENMLQKKTVIMKGFYHSI